MCRGSPHWHNHETNRENWVLCVNEAFEAEDGNWTSPFHIAPQTVLRVK